MHMSMTGTRVTLAVGLLSWMVGCAGQSAGDAVGQSRTDPPSNSAPGAHSSSQGAAGSGAGASLAGSPASGGNAGSNGATPGAPVEDGCAASLTSKREGCSCQAGETAACWTGPAADRNMGKCHDGLQICAVNAEFATWGPCTGEQLDCGEPDAGVPPPDAGTPPPPSMGCDCIPGAVIQCSEDCSVGIICSLTATKTCLPDRTWSTCSEGAAVTLDLPGFQCRNMLHGCLAEDGSPQGQGEIYVGDCSSQFTCGHAPDPLPTISTTEQD